MGRHSVERIRNQSTDLPPEQGQSSIIDAMVEGRVNRSSGVLFGDPTVALYGGSGD